MSSSSRYACNRHYATHDEFDHVIVHWQCKCPVDGIQLVPNGTLLAFFVHKLKATAGLHPS